MEADIHDAGDARDDGQLPQGRLQGHTLFAELVRQALATAARQGWPRVVLCDADFADWPLGEREVVDALQAWSARGRTLQLLACDYRVLRERHPRFVRWRVTWSHLVEARACTGLPAGELPSVLWSPSWCLQRIDAAHGTLVADGRRQTSVALHEQLQGWWQRSSLAFPASTLGL